MPYEQLKNHVRIELLGQFRVLLDDREVASASWETRRARELVQLLALSEGRRRVRDQAVETLWPHLDGEAGGANLRKAAHHARRALGDPESVVLRGGLIELFPGAAIETDVEVFLQEADAALAGADPAVCAAVAGNYAGELLPDAPYEVWTHAPRAQVQARLAELLRRSGQWERLVAVEPTEESAYLELMRADLAAGRRHAVIRWYERLRIAMIRELGRQPGAEARALYDECTAGVMLGETPFVGRPDELAAAMGAIQRAGDGRTIAVLVRGPAGIGKSAFSREVCNRAGEGGWRVLTTAATTSGTPYGPLSSAIEQLLLSGRESLETLPERTRSILAELTPLAGPARPLEGALTRHQVIAALRRALAMPATMTPTVLYIEDAHLSDEATADVLHQVVAGGGADPLVVMLAVRTEPVAAPHARGLTEVARAEGTTTLDLGPLGDAEVRELIATTASQPPDQELAERMVRLSGGSPFFAVELARSLTPGAPLELPRTAGDAITQHLGDLDQATVQSLAKLAVSETEVDLASVTALTGLDEDGAFAVLDEALEAGVLLVSGARYRFRHELVRQALVDDLAPHRRVALHRDAARRLADAGAPPEHVAHHWLEGERPAEAVEWLLAAAQRAAALGAFADALGHVEQLLEAEPAHVDGLSLRAEVLDALGDPRAPDSYAAAADAVGGQEAHELRARQALAQLKASDPDSALRTLEGVNPKSTIGLLAQALTLSASAAIGRYADADTAAAKAAEAHRLAVELGDPGAILDATWAQALASHSKGELPARLREYLRSTSDLPELATRVFDGQLCVTERMLYGGLPNEEIIAFADELGTEAKRLGAARGQAFASTLRGEAEILAGRLDEADEDFAEGARLHGQIAAVAGEALSLLGRAQVAVYRGTPQHAAPLLSNALVMARESEVGHHTLDRIYGTMVAAAPDPEAAVSVVIEAETAIAGPAETCPTCRIAFIVPAAIAAAKAGDAERARRYAQDCERAIEIIALPPAWTAAVSEVRGWLARVNGHEDDARRHFGIASDGFATWGQPLDAERCSALAAQ